MFRTSLRFNAACCFLFLPAECPHGEGRVEFRPANAGRPIPVKQPKRRSAGPRSCPVCDQWPRVRYFRPAVGLIVNPNVFSVVVRRAGGRVGTGRAGDGTGQDTRAKTRAGGAGGGCPWPVAAAASAPAVRGNSSGRHRAVPPDRRGALDTVALDTRLAWRLAVRCGPRGLSGGEARGMDTRRKHPTSHWARQQYKQDTPGPRRDAPKPL